MMAAWKLKWSGRHVRCVLKMMICLLLVTTVPGTKGSSTSVDSATGMASTTASPQNTSAVEVTQGEESASATECFLSIPSDEKEDVGDMIKEVFRDNAVFIYFKLNFTNLQHIYENSSNVIDPCSWVWAVEGKGELLLSYPFDFEQLSLGTLTFGVVPVEVPVSIPSDDCFQEAADDDKQRIIARFVGSLVQSANDTLNISNNEFYENKGSMVCVEKQISDELIGFYGLPLFTYYAIQASALYECWAGGDNPFGTESTLVRKHVWHGAIVALGVFLALFSPLAASFFIRKQESIKKYGKEYIALNADLPLGLKYLLCFSFHKYPAIVGARWFIYAVAFMMIPFVPYIVSYVMRSDEFIHRLDVAFELHLSQSITIFLFTVVNIVFLAIVILFISLYIRKNNFMSKSLEVDRGDRTYLCFIFKLPHKLVIPEKPRSSNTAIRTFMYTMWYRTLMAVNPDVWCFWVLPTFNFIYDHLGKRKDKENKNRCRLIVTFIIFIIVFPVALIIFCLLLSFNSVPLMHMLLWTLVRLFLALVLKSGDLANNFDIFLATMACFLSFAVFFIFVVAFIYIAEIISYTFIGFVMNSEFVAPVVIAIISVIAFLIKAVTNFYDGYCDLLKRTIETAEQVDKDLDKELEKKSEVRSNHNEGSETDPEAIALVEIQAAQPHGCRKLVEFQNGVPIIPLHLFKLVITKYQPIYLEVAKALFQLLIIVIVSAFGLTTIMFIGSVSDLPATVQVFLTVFVLAVVPVQMLIFKSPAKQKNDDAVNARHLKADIKYYAKCTPGEETFKTLIL